MTIRTVTGFAPKQETTARLPQAILQRLQSAMDQKDSIAELHNIFTDYCLALLFCCTGHRAVKSPFSQLAHFDLHEGLLLINDKASDETRAWRMVALPELAIEQLGIYRKYLRVLATRLQSRSHSGSLPAQILSLCSGGVGMPLFFYLHDKHDDWYEVTPATLARRWAGFWQLPINFQRHVMADELLRLTQRADWVSVQLGHTDGVDHPFGSTSSRSVQEVLREIRPYLNHSLKRMGWAVVRPPLSGAVARDVSQGLESATCPVPFGDARRTADRNARRLRAAELVRVLWNEQFSTGSSVDSASVQQLAQHIIIQAPAKGFSINWCLKLLYQYVRSRPGGLAVIRQLARYRRIEVEPSPFGPSSLVDYQQVRDARAGFVAYLDRQGRGSDDLKLHSRIAEIVCSAALFGGMANAERLQILGVSLLMHTHMLDGTLFVDLPLGQADATFRWLPDPVSQALIIGLFRMKFSHEDFSSARVRKSLKTLVEQIAGTKTQAPTEWLAGVASAATTIEMPGYIAACLRGDVPTVALPLPQWVRVTTGRRLKAVDPEFSLGGSRDSLWSPEIKKDSKRHHTAGEGREFLGWLRRIVSTARDTKTVGNQLHRTRSKRELIRLLQKNSADKSWSTLPVMLVGWGVHLCRHGTRYQGNLAYSTVEKYLLFAASRLLLVAADQDVGFDNEAVIEDLYLRAIDREAPERKFELASRFREMHSFFTEAYLLEDLDWSAVFGAAGGRNVASYADANYVSSEEYRQALQALIKEASLTERRRWQYAGLLLLGYRFGLRFGEALRLRYIDTQRDGDELHISVHGETKTAAGVRVVPLLERLTALEISILDSLLAAGEADFTEHTGAVLMSDRPGSVELLDRSEAARILNGLLRRVTGDPQLRFHHLRHGWVTRSVAAQQGFQPAGFNEQLSETAHEDFFGGPAGFPLRSVAVGAGHASELTTLASYTHTMDQLVHAHYKAPSLPDYAVSYAEQIAHATVRTRRRAGRKSAAGRLPEIPQPQVVTEARRAIRLSDLSAQAAGKVELDLVDVELLLRRYSRSILPAEEIARTLGLDAAIAQQILRRALEVELQTGYDGYGLAKKTADPIAASVRGQGYRQFARETARLGDELARIDREISAMLPAEQLQVWRGVAAWAETADGTLSSTCNVATTEQLAAIVTMRELLGLQIEAELPAAADTPQVRALLRSHGVDHRLVLHSRAAEIRLGITSPWPARTLQRLLLVMASGMPVSPVALSV